MYVTASFRPTRLGVSTIEEFGKKKLLKEEVNSILDEIDEKEVKLADELFEASDEETAVSFNSKKKRPRSLKTRFDIFEHLIKKKPKGYYKVWQSELQVLKNFKVKVYLHCVNDNKVCFRMSTRYAASPAEALVMTAKDPITNKKRKIEVSTSAAHKTFRMRMGHNDQSDGKRQVIGLSSGYCKLWPQKPFKKAWEDGIINLYCNYLIDPGCQAEKWTDFLL